MMILHNAGVYSGDENTLPQREHPKGARTYLSGQHSCWYLP